MSKYRGSYKPDSDEFYDDQLDWEAQTAAGKQWRFNVVKEGKECPLHKQSTYPERNANRELYYYCTSCGRDMESYKK